MQCAALVNSDNLFGKQATRRTKMIKKTFAATLVFFVCGVCASAQAGYRTEVKVLPHQTPNVFLVEFRIIDAKDGKILSSPKLTLKAGAEGRVEICDKDNGMICTAIIKEKEGEIETTTTVIIKEKGIEKLNHTHVTTIKKK